MKMSKWDQNYLLTNRPTKQFNGFAVLISMQRNKCINCFLELEMLKILSSTYSQETGISNDVMVLIYHNILKVDIDIRKV